MFSYNISHYCYLLLPLEDVVSGLGTVMYIKLISLSECFLWRPKIFNNNIWTLGLRWIISSSSYRSSSIFCMSLNTSKNVFSQITINNSFGESNAIEYFNKFIESETFRTESWKIFAIRTDYRNFSRVVFTVMRVCERIAAISPTYVGWN